jgi:hypothetical protein
MPGDMNLTILPGAATEDVKQIEEIVKTMDTDMQKLDATIKKIIPQGVETQWSTELRDRWEHFYSNEVKESMGDMLESAASLQRAVDAALEYNK